VRVTLILAALLACVLGCRRETPQAQDLVAAFGSARLGVDTGLIDFGVPAGRPYLLSGFSTDEDGIVWGVGPLSVLEFHLGAPRDLSLVFRCSPFEFPGAAKQAVTFAINGRPGPRVDLQPGQANYTVALPAGATRRGWNRLVVRYAWSRRPYEVLSSADARPLAVAWDFILFQDEPPGPRLPPTVDEPSGTLTIPPGTSVSYYVDPPPDARLAVDGVLLDGAETVGLGILLEGDGERRERLAELTRSPGGRWEIPLPHGWSAPFRLTFQADGGRVRLIHPVLLGGDDRPPAPVPVAVAPRRPNVLVYLVDTLRSDRLGCYGNHRPTSPRTDSLAADGVLFTNAVAESSWTRTSVASLLTGLAPRRHGVYGRLDALHDDATTMAGLLRAAGYETAGFVTNGNVAPSLGFGRGFDVYELLPAAIIPGSDGVVREPLPRSDDLYLTARRWLRGWDGRKPFFLYLHAADPHGPYLPPARFRRRLGVPEEDARAGSQWHLNDLEARRAPVQEDTPARVMSLYDAEIAHNDHYFGRVLAELKRRGLYDDALIVFVADHGEEFYEHGGWEHGKTLYREVVEIPLIVKLPGRALAGARLDRPAQLGDVLPTLLARLGLAAPPNLDGVDLLAGLGDGTQHTPRPTFAHLAVDGYVADAVETGQWKLVTGWAGSELFDRRADPAEQANVANEHLESAGYLRARLEEQLPRDGETVTRRADSLPDDVTRNLQALGYLE
jgi:arylsulfatase A-like enzyme